MDYARIQKEDADLKRAFDSAIESTKHKSVIERIEEVTALMSDFEKLADKREALSRYSFSSSEDTAELKALDVKIKALKEKITNTIKGKK